MVPYFRPTETLNPNSRSRAWCRETSFLHALDNWYHVLECRSTHTLHCVNISWSSEPRLIDIVRDNFAHQMSLPLGVCVLYICAQFEIAFWWNVVILSFLNRRLIFDVSTVCPTVPPTSWSFIWRPSFNSKSAINSSKSLSSGLKIIVAPRVFNALN